MHLEHELRAAPREPRATQARRRLVRALHERPRPGRNARSSPATRNGSASVEARPVERGGERRHEPKVSSPVGARQPRSRARAGRAPRAARRTSARGSARAAARSACGRRAARAASPGRRRRGSARARRRRARARSARPTARGRAQSRRAAPVGEEAPDRRGERVGSPGVDEQAVHAVVDDLGRRRRPRSRSRACRRRAPRRRCAGSSPRPRTASPRRRGGRARARRRGASAPRNSTRDPSPSSAARASSAARSSPSPAIRSVTPSHAATAASATPSVLRRRQPPGEARATRPRLPSGRRAAAAGSDSAARETRSGATPQPAAIPARKLLAADHVRGPMELDVARAPQQARREADALPLEVLERPAVGAAPQRALERRILRSASPRTADAPPRTQRSSVRACPVA